MGPQGSWALVHRTTYTTCMAATARHICQKNSGVLVVHPKSTLWSDCLLCYFSKWSCCLQLCSLPVQLRNFDITYGLFWWWLKGHLFWETWKPRCVTSDIRHRRKTLTHLLNCLATEYCLQLRVLNRTSELDYMMWFRAGVHNLVEG